MDNQPLLHNGHQKIPNSAKERKIRTIMPSSIDIQVKFYGDRPRGTPLLGELNTRGVAELSDFGPIERYTSEALQDGR